MSKKPSIPKLNQLDSNDVMGKLLARQTSKLSGLMAGMTIEGTVVEVGNSVLVLDIGAKSEGLVIEREFDIASSFIKTLKPGDKVQASVVVPETVNGQPLLSVRQAAQEIGWKSLETALKSNSEVEVRVENSSRGGLGVNFDGILGFIPTSQVGQEIAKNINGIVGKNLKVKVTQVDKEDGRVIFSERAISEAELIGQQEEALKSIKEGAKFRGKVVGVVNFGVFVQIIKNGVTLEGLVHLSEISWQKVVDPTKVLTEGQEVEVVALGPTSPSASRGESGRLALSIKRTQEDPWEKQIKSLGVDSQVKGKITKMGDAGAFIEVSPGIEGLLQFRKIPDGVSLKEGEEVNVFIEEIDQKSKKIGLGMVLKAKPVGYK